MDLEVFNTDVSDDCGGRPRWGRSADLGIGSCRVHQELAEGVGAAGRPRVVRATCGVGTAGRCAALDLCEDAHPHVRWEEAVHAQAEGFVVVGHVQRPAFVGYVASSAAGPGLASEVLQVVDARAAFVPGELPGPVMTAGFTHPTGQPTPSGPYAAKTRTTHPARMKPNRPVLSFACRHDTVAMST